MATGTRLHLLEVQPLPLCLSPGQGQTQSRVPAHRHSASLCLLGVMSLKAAWLSSCLAGKGSPRLLRSGADLAGLEEIWGLEAENPQGCAVGVGEPSRGGPQLLRGEGHVGL